MAKYRIRQKYFALKDRFAVNDMYDNTTTFNMP